MHPIHTEAVAWIAGIPELMFTFFCLLSLFLYLESGSTSDVRYVLALASFSVALFCKETAIILPVLIIACDLTFEPGYRLKYFAKRYIPFILLSGFYLAARFFVLGGLAPHRQHGTLTVFQCVMNIFPLFAGYLERVILPLKLNAFYVFHPVTPMARR